MAVVAALGFSSAGVALAEETCDAAVRRDVPTVVNIVNFVRGNEPRYPDIDLEEFI